MYWNSKGGHLHWCQFILLVTALVQWMRGMYSQISSCGCRYVRYLSRSIPIHITDGPNITRSTIALNCNFLFCMALIGVDNIINSHANWQTSYRKFFMQMTSLLCYHLHIEPSDITSYVFICIMGLRFCALLIYVGRI